MRKSITGRRTRAARRYALLQKTLELCFILYVFCCLPVSANEEDPIPTVILLDRSFSMTDLLNGQPKFEIAKTAFRNLAHRFQGQSIIAVRFFAGGRDKLNDQANCKANEIAIPLGTQIEQPAMDKLVSGIRPLGRKTNIAFAIEQATQDLAPFERGKIILISDGEENCEQDPIDLAQALNAKNIKIDTIGIGQPGQFSQLGRIALAGAGEFQLAGSAEQLANAIGAGLPQSLSPPAANTPTSSAMTTSISLPDGPEAAAGASSSSAPATPAPDIAPMTLEMEVVSEKPKDPVAIEVILDVSGSMAARIQGQRKMTLARAALHEAIRGLDSSAFLVGFRAYGFDNSVPKTPEASCPNTELLNSIAADQIASIREQVDRLQPFGYTPIAKSLELAGQDLSNTTSSKQMIILISDGEETCGGDPIAVAAQLRAMGIDIETHVIGFDLNNEQAKQMQAVASAGGGQFYDARDATELKHALVSVVEVAQEKIDPTWLRTIRPTTGGTTPETAVDLLPGTYTLSDFLEKGTQAYFRVNTKKGQYGIVRGLIQSRRLVREGQEMVESTTGYAQYRISLYQMRNGKNRGRFVRLSGEPGDFGHVGYSDTRGEGFIFTIGSNYDRVHKDALFNVEVIEAGDLYLGTEAPDSIEDHPVPLPIGEAITGHLGDGDMADIYQVAINDASPPSLRLYFTTKDTLFRSRITVKSATGKRILTSASKGEALDIAVNLPEHSGDWIYIEIKNSNPHLASRFSAYSLSLKAANHE